MNAVTETPTSTSKAKTKTVYNTITMADGRKVDFPGETKALKDFGVSAEGMIVGRIDFVNGQTKTIVIDPIASSALTLLAAAHGLSQKIGDSYSALKDPDDMASTAASLIARLTEKGADGWRQARAAGSGDAGIGLLVKALMEVSGADEDTVRTYLDTLSTEVKKALRESDPNVSPVYLRLKAERDAKKPQVDTSKALAGLQALAAGAAATDADDPAPV